MDYSIDVGSNLAGLGTAYLILKYLLSYVVGFLLLSLAAGAAYWLYRKGQQSSLSYNEILMGLIVGGLILIIIMFR